ncbi:SpoIIE family protein phosphatase [Streptomyces lancefieldiae]|uniref:SpoIIE family protein phosphatase n=1 Tax=Streptomyces lancefieldiae TaxID=3075520 RepID=A0ABU3AGE2_9ACTN|nr:SpoIIE family protein phosphatase [Streptomyces sp. DSM 40712]MDT0609249.1 SpoIIE family protein phosphatase [Streptomyces sp. DSM 40712]
MASRWSGHREDDEPGHGRTDSVPEPDFARAVLRDLGAGVLTLDLAARITSVNPWAEQMLGRSARDMIGHDAHDLLHRHADCTPVPSERCALRNALRGSPAEEGSEEHFRRADGTTVPIIWAATPLLGQGRQQGLVLVFHDFSLHRGVAEEHAARTSALEALTTQLHLVAEISTVLIPTERTSTTLRRLLRLLVPELGQWAAVDVYPGQSDRLERVEVRSSTHPHRAGRLRGPVTSLPDPARAALTRLVNGDRPVPLNVDQVLHAPENPLTVTHRALFERLGGHTAVVVPLRTRQRSYGMLTVARTGDHPAHTEAEVALLADIGRRVGLVLDNARLYHEQQNVAETMQRQLLTPLPQVDHVRMAARYWPAESAMEVGGDWYDAFLLADGVMALVIGDVVGHDLQAAAHMAEVRNMLRALAWDHQEPPSVIMRRLDEAVTHTSDAPMATLVFARVEGREGGPWRLHWVNAGHPPPLLIARDGDTRFLEGGHGPLIGMSATLRLGLGWPDTREDLPPESILLLYTDGLVESRDCPIDLGMARLRHHAGVLAGRLDGWSVDGFCDELLARIAPRGDDIALLALRLPPAGVGAPGDTSPPPPPQSAHSQATPDRAAPGSRRQQPEVTDPTHVDPEE